MTFQASGTDSNYLNPGIRPMPNYAEPVWSQLREITIRKRRIDTLVEFFNKLQRLGHQPTPEMVNGVLRVFPPAKTLQTRQALGHLLQTERTPDLSTFFRIELQNESEALRRMSLDASSKLKSLLLNEYRPWMDVIQAYATLDENGFMKQVDSWLIALKYESTIKDKIDENRRAFDDGSTVKNKMEENRRGFDNLVALSSRTRDLHKVLADVKYKVERTTVNLDFYWKLNSYNIQPLRSIYMSELADWSGNKEEIYRKWAIFKETSNQDIGSFFRRELWDLAVNLRQQERQLLHQFASQFTDKWQYESELTEINSSVKDRISDFERTKNTLLALCLEGKESKEEMHSTSITSKDIRSEETVKQPSLNQTFTADLMSLDGERLRQDSNNISKPSVWQPSPQHDTNTFGEPRNWQPSPTPRQ